ncbi:MAG: glycerophosphodiester phosphodiesterase family protein [Pseudomonadota bacterium]
MLKVAFLATTAVVLAACANEPSTPAERTAPTPSSSTWRLPADGDLNALFDCLDENDATLVSAHRGGAFDGFPENAIESMIYTLERAPAMVEFDVATSSDGVLYLMHDDTLDRTTTGSGGADAQPWSAISALKLKDRNGDVTAFSPPTFEAALSYLKGRTIAQIDFKSSTRYEDVVEIVKKQGADDRVIYIAYSMAAARKLHRLHPEAMISLSVNSQSDLNRVVAAGVPANRMLGFTGLEAPRPRLFRTLEAQNVEVIFGTLGGSRSIDRDIARTGDEDRYAEIASQGVDIIATDRPLAAHNALANAGLAPKAGVCGIAKT